MSASIRNSPPIDRRAAFLGRRGPLAIAHRGGNQAYAENSLDAFAHAFERGFDFVETDAHLTRDGVVVAFHDRDLTRMLGRREAIEALGWDEVRSLELPGASRIPAMHELLRRWPRARITIDPKSDAVLVPLLDLIERLGCAERVCIGSFSHARLHRVRERFGPAMLTSASPREVLSVRLASLGFPRACLAPVRAGCLQVPCSHYRVPVVEPRLVDYAHAHGLPVQVWTINDPEQMHRLLDLGVDAIMTDDLDAIADVFASRGLSLNGQSVPDPSSPSDVLQG